MGDIDPVSMPQGRAQTKEARVDASLSEAWYARVGHGRVWERRGFCLGGCPYFFVFSFVITPTRRKE